MAVADYTDLATVKANLNIDDEDDVDDAILAAVIAAASQQIDQYCGRTFVAAGSASARVVDARGRTHRGPDGDVLLVDDIGALSGLTVETGPPGGSSWSDVTARVEALPLDAIARGWPVTELLLIGGVWPARVRVTAAWGWPSTPAVVEQAAVIQAIRLYKRKDSPEGVLGSTEWSGPVRVTRVDPDVQALLRPLVLPGIG